MDELRLGFRRLSKHPAATIASMATLACAIGAAAATWSLLSAVLLHPLPVDRPEHLFVVGTPITSGRAAGTLSTAFVYPYYPHVRESGAFDRLAAVWGRPMSLLVDAGAGRAPAQVSFVSSDFFGLLGVPLQSGRSFGPEEDRRGAPPVAVVSDRYWRRTLNAGDVVGRTITISRCQVSVIGIAAAGFRGLSLAQAPDFYLPFHTIADVADPRMNYFALPNVFASPTAGVMLVGRSSLPPPQLNARLAALPSLAGWGDARLTASPIETEAIPAASRAGMIQFGRILAATVVLLLLAGCMTVGMLLLVRTEARRDEFAMCLALGASRARLARGVIIEGALLSASGAALALPVASWLFSAVRAFQLPGGVALELLDLALDLRVFAAAAVGVLAAVLVASQVAVAVVLAAGAGVFTRTLQAALSLNPGFDTERLVTGGLALQPYGYSIERSTAFFDTLDARLRTNRAIRSLAFLMSQGSMRGTMRVDGVRRQFPTDVQFTAVDERYFSTMGLHVLAGRELSAEDTVNAPLVGVVSESLARLLGNGGSAPGRRITMPYSRPPAPPPEVQVVGVVPDVITNVSVLEPLMLYLPLARQGPAANRDFVVLAAGDPRAARSSPRSGRSTAQWLLRH